MGITKRDFRVTIEALRDQYDYDKARSLELSQIYGADVSLSDNSRLTNAIFNNLHTDLPPTNDVCAIQLFCYQLDFGRSSDIEQSPTPICDLWDSLQAELLKSKV